MLVLSVLIHIQRALTHSVSGPSEAVTNNLSGSRSHEGLIGTEGTEY